MLRLLSTERAVQTHLGNSCCMRLNSLRALLAALLVSAMLAGPAAARPASANLAPPPAADGARIAAAFAKLSRTTTWQLVGKVPLKTGSP